MTALIATIEPAHLKSLHQTFNAIAGEQHFFVRPVAPEFRELKHIAKDAVKRNHPFFVALEREVVGWIRIAFPKLEALAHSGTLVMGLRSTHRRQGIGTRLLRTAVAHAFEDSEKHRIQLEVLGDNAVAIAFYSKNGFRIEGTAEKAVRLNGELRSIVHMARVR